MYSGIDQKPIITGKQINQTGKEAIKHTFVQQCYSINTLINYSSQSKVKRS